MMLVSVPELSLWAEGDADVIDPDDPLAIWILEQASVLVMDQAQQPTWTQDTAPGRAKIVVANVAKRCWNNGDMELRTAIAGGPTSQVIDMAAYGLNLTDAEKAELGTLTPAATMVGAGYLFVQPTTRGEVETNLYLPDEAYPESDLINYLTPANDPYYFPTYD